VNDPMIALWWALLCAAPCLAACGLCAVDGLLGRVRR
jgi:hypothetical protein